MTFSFDRDNSLFINKFETFLSYFKRCQDKSLKQKTNLLPTNLKTSKLKVKTKIEQFSKTSTKNNLFKKIHKNYFQNAKKELQKKSLKTKCEVDYNLATIPKSYFAGENLWLIKPSGYNRGLGVELFDDLEDLKGKMEMLLKGYWENLQVASEQVKRSKKAIKSRKFVIQKYIERPLLYRKKKFDMRLEYMLLLG